MADRSDTRPGLDLAIQAVTRRRRDAERLFEQKTPLTNLAAANARLDEVCAVLIDLHALRQEAGE